MLSVLFTLLCRYLIFFLEYFLHPGDLPICRDLDVLNEFNGCEVSFISCEDRGICLVDHFLLASLLLLHVPGLLRSTLDCHPASPLSYIAQRWRLVPFWLHCLLLSFSSVPPFKEHILMKAVTGPSLKPSLGQYPMQLSILDHPLHTYLGDGAFLLILHLSGARRSFVYNSMSPSDH